MGAGVVAQGAPVAGAGPEVEVMPRPMPADCSGNEAARRVYEHLVREIGDYESRLDREHEVGAYLTSGVGGQPFYIKGLAYRNPDIVTFLGELPDGKEVRLIQHVSQFNILLTTMPRVKGPEPFRVGFLLEHHGKAEQAGEEPAGPAP